MLSTSRLGAVSTIVGSLRAHARAASLILFLIFIISVAVGFALPRPFVATTDLWLDRGHVDATRVAPETTAARLARNTELRLLISRELASRTVAALGLERVRGLGQPRNGTVLNEADARAEAIRAVQQQLSVKPIDDSYAVRIRFRADRSEIAASVANRLADLYVDDRSGVSGNARERQQLTAAVTQARDSLVRSEAALTAYRSAVAALGGANGDLGTGLTTAALDAELREAIRAARLAHLREDKALAAAGPIVRDLERRREQRAVEDDARSDAIDRQIARQRRGPQRFAAQVRLADSRVRLLSQLRERSARTAAEAGRVGAELARLDRAAAAARIHYAQALAASERAKESESRRRSTAYVISRSSAESAVRAPGNWTIPLASLGIAAAVALAVALALDARHKGFVTAGAVERRLGAKVLAMVPELTHLPQTGTIENRSAVPDHLVQEPRSAFAEVFRGLLAALQVGGVRQGPLVIALSSALPDEGKTTVALCLARSAALSGRRTVLVDCDVRRPAASRALLPTLPVGLIEVTKGEAELSAVLQQDPGSDAMVLGIGTDRATRAVALDPKDLRPVIDGLKRDFDVIVCDCPPALALSEARETAALANVVLLAVRQRETPRGAVSIAQDLLTRSDARIAGVVLTMVRA